MSAGIFPAVEPASVVFDQLQRLREVISADPGLSPNGGAQIQTELQKMRRTDPAAKARFYWSAQQNDPGARLGFTARTLYDDHRLAVPTVHDFPDEPVMTWLAESVGGLSEGMESTSVQILRYIPRRRVTLRADDLAGLPARVIVKTKERPSLLRATRVLIAVRRSLERREVESFAVPRAVRLDAGRQLLYLEELPGAPLDQVLDQIGQDEAMSRVGTIHRILHELDVDVGKVSDRTRSLRGSAAAVERIAMFLPSLRPRVAQLYDELARTAPEQDGRAFCQGDFVPSQILCDPSGWSVLDFDDAHHGDPWAEVAALYVSLPRELSLREGQEEAVRGAYVRAYVEAAGFAPDPATWRWCVLAAQLRYIAQRLSKGRALPGQTERLLDGIDSGSLRLPL